MPSPLLATLILPPGATPAAWEDLTGDGRAEVVWMSESRRRIVVTPEDAPGLPTFDRSYPEDLNVPSVLDVDGDGLGEVIWVGRISGTLYVLDAGEVHRVTLGYSVAATLALLDVAGDERPELLAAQEGFPARVLAVSIPDYQLVRTFDDASGDVFLAQADNLAPDGTARVLRYDNAYREPPDRLVLLDRSGAGATIDDAPSRYFAASDLDGDGHAEVWSRQDDVLRVWDLRDDGFVERTPLPMPDCAVAVLPGRLSCVERTDSSMHVLTLQWTGQTWLTTHRSAEVPLASSSREPGLRRLRDGYALAVEAGPDATRVHRIALQPSQSGVGTP